MQEQQYSAMIGAIGWEHPDWAESFYPQDLPEDWQFGYYSNEFPVVMVTLSYMLAAERAVLEEWLDECHENFRFIIELDVAFSEHAEDVFTLLGDRLIAVVMDKIRPLPSSLSALARFCRQSEQDCEQLMAAGEALVWDGKGTYCPSTQLALVELDSEEYQDMHDLKEVISQGQSALNERQTMVILFKGNPPDLETMRAARTICELLGM